MVAPHYGKPGSTLPDDVQADILNRCRAGEGRNQISEATGVNRASVSGVVDRAGLTFTRAKETRGALEARQADLARRRAALIDRSYALLERNFDLLEGVTFKTLVKSGGGSESIEILDFVPTVDQRNLADVFARYVTGLTRLEQVDAERGNDTASNLLADLGRHLGIVASDD